MVYGTEKHLLRTGVEFVIVVECAVDYELFAGFGMLGDAFDEILVAFEMAVDTVDFELVFHGLIIAFLGSVVERCNIWYEKMVA